MPFIDSKDQRVTLIHLTPKGLEIRLSINEKLESVDRKVFQNFTEEENQILRKMLVRIQNQLLEELNNEDYT